MKRIDKPSNTPEAINARIDSQLSRITNKTAAYAIDKVYRPYVLALAQLEREEADPYVVVMSVEVLIANMVEEIARACGANRGEIIEHVGEILLTAEKVE